MRGAQGCEAFPNRRVVVPVVEACQHLVRQPCHAQPAESMHCVVGTPHDLQKLGCCHDVPALGKKRRHAAQHRHETGEGERQVEVALISRTLFLVLEVWET